MRHAIFCLLLLSSPAWAQLDQPPEPPLPPPPQTAPPQPAPGDNRPSLPPAALPAPPPPVGLYGTVVRGTSPTWTQDRSFTSTRFWRLDPGVWEVETWLRTRIGQPDAMTGVRPTEMLWQVEAMVGINPHLQLDVYANFINDDIHDPQNPPLRYEGTQIEARISIPRYYGQMFGNPVIYLEWHPRHDDPDRAEVRLLMGGAPTRWLYLAVNPYVELNVEPTTQTTAALDQLGKPTLVKTSKYIADMEFGSTVAVGFRVTDWFRVSAELKIGADMLGDENNQLHFVWWGGGRASSSSRCATST